ncbi:MAG: hypothetical protein V7L29_13385 [Nostoc sp.]|uniref:hypothetical protein n=1 Tax=Nostoc sp. TaxID=1180 RepID=UPI002FF4F6D2
MPQQGEPVGKSYYTTVWQLVPITGHDDGSGRGEYGAAVGGRGRCLRCLLAYAL